MKPIIHLCHAEKCKRNVPPSLMMCARHWRMVPKKLQRQVWAYYRKGQEIDKNPSDKYMCAYRLAVNAVAKKEGNKQPFNTSKEIANLERLNLNDMRND